MDDGAIRGKGEDEFLERRDFIEELRKATEESALTVKRLNKLVDLVSGLETDPYTNVCSLLATGAEVLNAACIVYNRIEDGLLRSMAKWNIPDTADQCDVPDGLICYEMLDNASNRVVVIRNLLQTPYGLTDPNAIRYNLQTYMGCPVRFAETNTGFLCAFYQKDFAPTELDKVLFELMASAIAWEEKRLHLEYRLQRSLDKPGIGEGSGSIPATSTRPPCELPCAGFVCLAEKIEDGIAILDKDGSILYTNPVAAAMPPAWREALLMRLSGLKGHGYLSVEVGTGGSDGTKGSFDLTVETIDWNGTPAFLGIMTDVTERRRAENALIAGEKRYRQLVENANDIIYATDAKGRLTVVNAAALRIAGYSRDELVGKHCLSLVHPDYRKDAEKFYRAQFVNRILDTYYEFPALTKQGRPLWLGQNVRLVTQAGKIMGFHAVCRDVTERKKAEDALRESEEKYRLVVENVNEMIFVIQDGMVRFANPKAMELLGHSEDTVGDRSFDELVHPADRQLVSERVLRKLSGDEGPEAHLLRVIDKRGNPSWGYLNSVPVSWDEKPATLVFGTDVTALKQAEEALREAHDELEQRVRERTAELQAATEEMKRFTYIVSHDLRVPLTNIKAFGRQLHSAANVVKTGIQPLLERLDGNERTRVSAAIESDLPEALGFIDSSAARMEAFISALLKLSRLGRRELMWEELDMNELVADTLRTMSHKIAAAKAKIEVDTLLPVIADRLSVEQIMGNMLVNAVDYLQHDRSGEIRVTSERDAEFTTFHVKDNGRGIRDEDVPKVFEFYRRVGKQDVPGEGVGLAYVAVLVRRHGGRIRCTSELGVGSTFSFSIPNDPPK